MGPRLSFFGGWWESPGALSDQSAMAGQRAEVTGMGLDRLEVTAHIRQD